MTEVLAGFNEDLVVEGLVYHVQSEDRGQSNPILETLVYRAGQILHQVREPYDDMIQDGNVDERKLVLRLERQHKDMLRRTRHGEFAPEGRRTLAELIPESESIDDLLRRLLEADAEFEPLNVVWRSVRGASSVCGRVHVRLAKDDSPIAGAQVKIRGVDRNGIPKELTTAETGVDGTVAIGLTTMYNDLQALVFRVERGPGGGRLRVPVVGGLPRNGSRELSAVGSAAPAGSRAPGSSS